MTLINRGWGLTTLNVHPNRQSDLEGGVNGLKEYEFDIKWSRYVQKYKVKVLYDCDRYAWTPMPWKVNPVSEIFFGGQEYTMIVPDLKLDKWAGPPFCNNALISIESSSGAAVLNGNKLTVKLENDQFNGK